MINQVTHRFILCIERIIKQNKIPSYRQFALSLEYFPQGLNEILKKKRNVTIDLIQKACHLYSIDANYLFTGKGTMFIRCENSPNILTVVTDNDNNEKIVHVPITAHAGYSNNISNPVFFENLKTFSLPGFGFNTGSHRCFDVAGDSMEPYIINNDQLICRYMDPDIWLNNVRTNMVYIFITIEGIVVKRAKRIPNNDKTIILISDNNFYEPFQLNFSEIKEIWSVRYKISQFLNTKGQPQNELHREFDHMKSTVKALNSTIERLLQKSDHDIKNNDYVH